MWFSGPGSELAQLEVSQVRTSGYRGDDRSSDCLARS